MARGGLRPGGGRRAGRPRGFNALVIACRAGRLEVAQWLVGRFGLEGSLAALNLTAVRSPQVAAWVEGAARRRQNGDPPAAPGGQPPAASGPFLEGREAQDDRARRD